MPLFRSMALAAVLLSVSSTALAGIINVWGERFNLSTINNLYNSNGYTSSIIRGPLDTNDLTGVDLLWAVQPGDAYTAREIATMSSFLSGGGRIAFMGEHGAYAPNQNNRISAAIAALGGNMSIINTIVDGGYRTAYRSRGQILPNALTAGVSRYQYAAFAPLRISGNAQALMLSQDRRNVMMAYENIGPGSIFVITDQNVFTRSSRYDNVQMFLNLASADTGAPPVDPGPGTVSVPEPASLALMGLGLVGLGFARREKKAL